jgi:hypothetical protein
MLPQIFMRVTVHVDNVSGRVDSLVPNLENSLEHCISRESSHDCWTVMETNIANGPQQVNNGVPTQTRPHAGISGNQSNELLGLSHEQRLDIRTAGAASGAHRQLETVGAVVRTDD